MRHNSSHLSIHAIGLTLANTERDDNNNNPSKPIHRIPIPVRENLYSGHVVHPSWSGGGGIDNRSPRTQGDAASATGNSSSNYPLIQHIHY